MRNTNAFFDEYKDALFAIDPATAAFKKEQLRTFAQTELCLAFLNKYLPDEEVRTVPALMMGYPQIMGDNIANASRHAMVNVRHLCSRFASMSAWVDALMQHTQTQEVLRCFNVCDRLVETRPSAAETLLAVLDEWLSRHVPWTERRHQVAKPGEAVVFLDHSRTKVSYHIPAIPAERQAVKGYTLKPRTYNPPIKITFDELKRVSEEVDAREARDDWPADSLPPIHLTQRLDKLETQDVAGFYDGTTYTLDGATHLVGMLSSGKSTFVIALLFALTLGSGGKRIAVLVSDTMQGASLSARLRRHSVNATVLSSFRNREGHLQSIHWQHSLNEANWSLSPLGDLAVGFSTACPLDGAQSEPELIEDDIEDRWRFPKFLDKQCHCLYQTSSADDDDENANPDDVGDRTNASSCPLWSTCPAQAQQRTAVDASVLIMTPAAFIHMTPDVWTTRSRISLPELVQYEFDLVIVDEVDSVQKTFDEIFTPRSPIMGDEQNNYAPSVGLKSSEALRQRSGIQFRKPVNAKWQSNFFTFFRLIGAIYAMLQNEREALQSFYQDSPFTAGSILYDLWRRRSKIDADTKVHFTLDNQNFAKEFLDVIKVAGAINRYARGTSVSDDQDENDDSPRFIDDRFEQAANALRDLARQLLVTDYYEGVIEEIESELAGRLSVFNAVGLSSEKVGELKPRHNALALILATVTALALSHYNWLVKTQVAVARDFQIEDSYLLGQASGLIKNYRTLLPANPAGAAFGLFYDDPRRDQTDAMGGKLTLISHLGVGRHLLTHLHDLLAFEGQAGPHTLLLSGTSWAGGSVRAPAPRTRKPMACSSPSFDVQVPVKAILVQPEEELEAISHSVFSLMHMPDANGRQLRISGTAQERRKENLAVISRRFATPSDGLNRFERDWSNLSTKWADWKIDALDDRRRALLVTNSYDDAAIVADALADAFNKNGYSDWSVNCLVRDRDDTLAGKPGSRLRWARPLPRSLIERFGEQPEQSVLVAPMQNIARGHNILNGRQVAAISSMYFLHRVHPRPDDLGPTIGRLNRSAQAWFDHGLMMPAEKTVTVASRAQKIRYEATHIVRHGLEAGRGGYQTLPAEYKAQFAWDMLTSLWQTIGRGIRGGSPVFAAFVDYAFAPLSFDCNDGKDTPSSSALVQCIKQLELAIVEKTNPTDYKVAQMLYRPFYDALKKTKGLCHDE